MRSYALLSAVVLMAVGACLPGQAQQIAEPDEASADAASLSEDQSQVSPEPHLGVPNGPGVEAAANAGLLPVINIKPRDPNTLDPGTLCQSKFAQRSPICAAKH